MKLLRTLAASAPFWAAGCIAPLLEWQQVGVYGPNPSADQILQASRELLVERSYRIQTFDLQAMRVETEWTDRRGLTVGVREQIRIRLVPYGNKTYVFVMAIKNDDLGEFHPGHPAHAAWGPDENFRARETQMQNLIHKKIMEISKNP
jgi:hypothetical protein